MFKTSLMCCKRERNEKMVGLCNAYNNAPCHISFAVQQFLFEQQIPYFYKSLYLPCDFWLILNLIFKLKENVLCRLKT